MPHVVALYRYPVKSFTPESRQSLTILPDGRIAGDRVLGFRFADTPEPDEAWSRKHGMVALMHTPGIARLRLSFDDTSMRIRVALDGAVIADEALDADGRRRLCDAVGAYISQLDESGLQDHPEHLPLRLIGDGHTPRYHDRPDGYVTLHGRASVAALAQALGDPDVSELRFRSNVAVDGFDAWQEQSWLGKTLRIGGLRFRVHMPIRRCLATHANPQTGERDRPVLTTLTRSLGQEEPTMAVALVPLSPGEIRLGDEIELEG
jgi:uncharacterized protein YcbX